MISTKIDRVHNKNRAARGKLNGEMRMGKTPQSVMNWWLDINFLEGQMSFNDLGDDLDMHVE